MSDKRVIIETVGTLHDSLLLLVDRLGFILDELEQDQQGPGPANCGTDEVGPPGGWLQ